MLSGLLKCGVCGYRYTMADNHFYACGSVIHHLGCGNTERVRRDNLQKIILEPVTQDLLSPARVVRMAKSRWRRIKPPAVAQSAKSASIPKELQALDARLTGLRARLATGDPDMKADELQAAIAKVEAKRAELLAAR